MAKPKIATAWMAGCAGCHMSFLDIDEKILDVVKLVDITASPITDFKHFEQVDVGIVEGAVNTTKDEEVLRDLRAHCKILMAWGDCACFGGIVTVAQHVRQGRLLPPRLHRDREHRAGQDPVIRRDTQAPGQGQAGESRRESRLLRAGMSAQCQGHLLWPGRASQRQDPGVASRHDAL